MSDFLVIGGGIAGAAAGFFLSRHGTVTLLEAEDAPGRHATGRSAAVFSEYYGNAVIRQMTAASRAFLEQPPDGFADTPLLTPRGVLVLCPPDTDEAYRAALATGRTVPGGIRELTASEAREYWPELRPDRFERFLLRPSVCDIDVAALHHGFLRGLTVVTGARVETLARQSGHWHAATTAGSFRAPVVVDAAGAWGDEVALAAGVAPVGLVARRRTAALAPFPAAASPHQLAGRPMLADLTETFYAKPESGGLLISPADATPQPPGDVRPDDLDVATAVARVEEATTLRLRHISHTWAGLRSSVFDDTPVIGTAPEADGFFWHTGFGGFGVQVAAAAGELLAALVVGAAVRGEVTPARLAVAAGI